MLKYIGIFALGLIMGGSCYAGSNLSRETVISALNSAGIYSGNTVKFGNEFYKISSLSVAGGNGEFTIKISTESYK